MIRKNYKNFRFPATCHDIDEVEWCQYMMEAQLTLLIHLGLFLRVANGISCDALESKVCLEEVSLVKDCITKPGKFWIRDSGPAIFLAETHDDLAVEITPQVLEQKEAIQVQVKVDLYKTAGCRVTELFTWIRYYKNGE